MLRTTAADKDRGHHRTHTRRCSPSRCSSLPQTRLYGTTDPGFAVDATPHSPREGVFDIAKRRIEEFRRGRHPTAPAQSRVFYGFIAVGGDRPSAVVALRGTVTAIEWSIPTRRRRPSCAATAWVARSQHCCRGHGCNHAAEATGIDIRVTSGGRRATLAARYGGLRGVSWRMYNHPDISSSSPGRR